MERGRFWINGSQNFDAAWSVMLERARTGRAWSWREIANASGVRHRAMQSLLSRLQEADMVHLVRPHDSTLSVPALYQLNTKGLAVTDPCTEIQEVLETDAAANGRRVYLYL